MTLATTVGRATALLGLPEMPGVVSSPDPIARQMLALAVLDAEDLARRADWPGITRERTFTTVASIAQPGALPADFGRMAFRESDRGDLYDVGRRMGIAGPASSAQWRELTSGFAAWTVGWRIAGGVLEMAPAPPAGRTMRFDYVTENLFRSGDGVGKAEWTDGDTCLLPERLITLGLVWRFKAAKGLEYAEDMATAEREIEREIGQAGGGRRVLIAGRPRAHAETYAFPGVLGRP